MMHDNNHFLDSLLEPVVRCFTPEVAEKIVRLRADVVAQARLEELAEKCNAGSLSAAERDEYEAYVAANRFIALVQATARRLLQSRPVVP
jgi:hypothetical protein